MKVQGKIFKKLPVVKGVSNSGKDWIKQDFVIETTEQYPKKIAFKNALFVPYQNALKFRSSVKPITLPLPYTFMPTPDEFFNFSKFSSEIYPLIKGLEV